MIVVTELDRVLAMLTVRRERLARYQRFIARHHHPEGEVSMIELKRMLLRADGTEEDLPSIVTIREIKALISAPDALDVVNLRHAPGGWVMLVDDTGMIDGRPVNAKATELYHANCRPGTTHQICGDVVLQRDEDFGP